MRLIDADQFGAVSFQGKSEDFAEGVAFILDKIYEAPTIEERPHGEWKPDGTCSECGVYSSLNKNTAYFCPNCGADMRDKKDDLAEIIEAVQSIKEGEANDKDPDNR